MPRKSSGRKTTRRSSSSLAPRTRKAIDTLPSHAQHIYAKAHERAIAVQESNKEERMQATEPGAGRPQGGVVCGEKGWI